LDNVMDDIFVEFPDKKSVLREVLIAVIAAENNLRVASQRRSLPDVSNMSVEQLTAEFRRWTRDPVRTAMWDKLLEVLP